MIDIPAAQAGLAGFMLSWALHRVAPGPRR